MDTAIRSLRYALRALARTPGFTATVVLTFAIGIGANSAVFTALDAVLLKDLPYPDADRLVSVRQVVERSNEDNASPARLEDWSALNTSFEAVTGYYPEDVSETTGELPEKLRRATVAPRFFDVWRVRPLLGRGFTSTDHAFPPAAVVVISERFWRTRYGADPNVLGKRVRVDNVEATIVGVMPSAFRVPERAIDLWRPAPADSPYARQRDLPWYDAVGRLKPGVTLARAQADMNAVQAGLAERFPKTDAAVGVRLVPFKSTVVAGAGGSLWLLYGAASAVLLIACANVATLLLARSGRRARELALRLSLGASPSSLVGQLLLETGLLAGAGGAVGLLVAASTGRALGLLSADLPRVEEVGLNGGVLLYSLAAVIVTTLGAGLLPALRAALAARPEGLAGGGRSQVSSGHTTQWLLVGAQIALSVALLASAGLLVRTLVELAHVDPGFQPSKVLMFRMSSSYAESTDWPRVQQRIERTLDALDSLPGADAAAVSLAAPGVPGRNDYKYTTTDGRVAPDTELVTQQNQVSPSYFQTLGIPLVAGDLCRTATTPRPGAQTASGSALSAAPADELLVNEQFVRTYFPGADARSIAGIELRGATQYAANGRVVGVVADSRDGGLDAPVVPAVYQCTAQQINSNFLVRTRGDPLALAAAIRLRMKDLEPLRSVYDIAPLDERIGQAFSANRMRALLIGLFAAAALALACIGVYGTLAYIASLARREVGLRIALGAPLRRIVAQFVLVALRVAFIASVVGALLALAAGRWLAGMLYGVSPADPLTIGAVVAIVLGMAALAALVPALLATRVEPMDALREQ